MITETCPACRGEGAIPHGQRWSDGEPLYWEPCITCDTTGEIEVEAFELEGDEDDFFGGTEMTETTYADEVVLDGLLDAFRNATKAGVFDRKHVAEFNAMSVDDRLELLFCIMLLGAREMAQTARKMMEELNVERQTEGTAAAAPDEVSAPGPADTRQ